MPSANLSRGGAEQVEIVERTIHRVLDFCGVRIRPACQKDIRLAVRRLTILAWMVRRDGFDTDGAAIARAFGMTRQGVNLDVQRLSRELQLAAPTAHKSTLGRAPGWVRRGVDR